MMGDILKGSLVVKVSEPLRMSPRLLTGLEGEILVGSFVVKVK